MNQAAVSPALPLTDAPARRSIARRVLAIVLGSLFVAVCAHVSIPLWFTPVPLTLQPFAVLLLGLLLSPSAAAGALLLYLAEGAAGLPVFTPGTVGLLHLFGPTGGYLLSYPFVAALIAWLRRRIGNGGFASSLAAAATGDAVILLSGAAWLGVLTHQSPATTFTLAVLPFLPGEILKIATAAATATSLRRFRRS
jgi:biotin transport system substrate-specific component